MSRALTPIAIQAINSQETDEIFLFILEFDEASLPSPIRIVNNTENITSNGDLYVAYPFEIELPTERGESIDTVKVTISNVDQQLVSAIRLALGRPTVALNVILASDPDTVEAGPFDFELESADYNVLTITGNLAFDDVGSLRSPAHTVTPWHYPDLF